MIDNDKKSVSKIRIYIISALYMDKVEKFLSDVDVDCGCDGIAIIMIRVMLIITMMRETIY